MLSSAKRQHCQLLWDLGISLLRAAAHTAPSIYVGWEVLLFWVGGATLSLSLKRVARYSGGFAAIFEIPLPSKRNHLGTVLFVGWVSLDGFNLGSQNPIGLSPQEYSNKMHHSPARFVLPARHPQISGRGGGGRLSHFVIS